MAIPKLNELFRTMGADQETITEDPLWGMDISYRTFDSSANFRSWKEVGFPQRMDFANLLRHAEERPGIYRITRDPMGPPARRGLHLWHYNPPVYDRIHVNDAIALRRAILAAQGDDATDDDDAEVRVLAMDLLDAISPESNVFPDQD